MFSNLNKGFSCSSAGKESTCNAGDPGLIPGSRKSSGDRNGYPLQYSGLQNSMDWKELDTTEQLSLSGLGKTQTRLSLMLAPLLARCRALGKPFNPTELLYPIHKMGRTI